ncbi:M23 family metallopeptidase [Membranihabitans maritimus]|uniref:M23 family metallopeptidase n=1 Tax=Membranihabitans maritimus TaxID=2904244 RepID=UPI001F299E2C|nr:M23 family metallopeptidase [Membranihabitans maritimus]
MDDIKNKDESWWRKGYRMVLINTDTLKTESVHSFSRIKLFLLTIAAIIVSFLFFYLIVSLTPIKKIIPGFYAQMDAPELIKLRKHINEMEEQLVEQDQYITSLRGLISGRPLDSLQKRDLSREIAEEPQVASVVNRIDEDKQLRDQVERKDRLSALRENITQDRPSALNTVDEKNLIAPVLGPIGKGYDPTDDHFGIDILASKNTAIKAIASGVVVQADWSVETGNSIMILHDNGLISVYKHNSSLLKKNYARVEAGEAIAIIGNTGTLSSGPHLHFELWNNGMPEDPQEYINFN